MTEVHTELQRLQTWLFSVPRLRAMVGANVLLGEVLRIEIPELARKNANWSLAPVIGGYPNADADDPLKDHDDPAADARDGILARDGGHFEAVFSSGAEIFEDAAADLLRRKLPGLRFRISINRVERTQACAALSTELPVFAPCEWMGRGLASVTAWQGNEPACVALDVWQRHEAAKRAENGEAYDLASLLSVRTKLGNLRRPETFEELAGDGYLAVIHADGNNVGRVGRAAEADYETRARFFHRNRVLLRRALAFAIDRVCENTDAAPLLLLMLGGDDILVVCQAGMAMRFVISLCEKLAEIQKCGNGFLLTMGVGVVFAKPTVPIYRLHNVAEHLAASAKRRFRGFSPDQSRSVVDWAVYTTAWPDDPEDVRRRDWVRGSGVDARVLSRRPLDVLGDGLDSLQGLVRAAEQLDGIPRSQLRYLADQLPRGKALSELAFEELSRQARERLEAAGVSSGSEIWIPADGANGTGPYVTSVLDLVDVFEIGRLGRAGTTLPKHPEKDLVEQ